MSVPAPTIPIRPAREEDLPRGEGDLLHALTTDPDGVLVARKEGGPILGLAAGAVRGDVLSLIHLDVARSARGKGVGAALFSAVRAYGASRGTRMLEFAREADDAALGFLLGAGLPVRGVALRLSRRASAAPKKAAVSLSPLGPGAPLSGWVAALDRETRGFSRTADWSFWMRRGTELFAMRRGGRPEGVGAVTFDGGRAALGPVEAATPETATTLLLALAAEARDRGAADILVTLPAEARLLVQAALQAGFRLAGSFPVLAGRTRGDLRRYAASPTAFF